MDRTDAEIVVLRQGFIRWSRWHRLNGGDPQLVDDVAAAVQEANACGDVEIVQAWADYIDARLQPLDIAAADCRRIERDVRQAAARRQPGAHR